MYASSEWPANPPMSELVNRVHNVDCFELLAMLPDKSVDMVLCDPPYAVHEADWDQDIEWSQLWPEFQRVLKPRGACVLTAVMRLAWKLIAIDPQWFKYDMVGLKTIATDYFNAKNKPMRCHENILVFSHGTTANCSEDKMDYFPQMQSGIPYIKKDIAGSKGKSVFGGKGRAFDQKDVLRLNVGERYPTTVVTQKTMSGAGNFHPNQKPVDLFEYLIRSYTLPNMIVCDPFVGSGTTAIAARNTGRQFIVGDQSADYCGIARQRLSTEFGSRKQAAGESLADLPMFATLT